MSNYAVGDFMSEECSLCRVVDDICERLPTEEARQKCKELTRKIERGEIDGRSARQELFKYVDRETFSRIVQETLPRLLQQLRSQSEKSAQPPS
jgi:hypothetical protein